MTRLGEHTIVLVEQVPTGARDRYGVEQTRDGYTLVEGCLVTPTRSTETPDGSRPVVTGLDLLAPAGFPIASVDAVIWPATATGDSARPWAGTRFEVDGEVGDWGDFVQVQLQRST